MRRRSRTIALAALALSALACAGLALSGPPSAAAQRAEREAATRRWEARSFTRYRMVIEQGNCTADYEVRGERIAWGHEVPCGRGQARTVDNLLTQLAHASEEPACVGTGCICERISTTRARFNPQLGYPEEIVVRTQVVPSWTRASFWQHLARDWSIPCSAAVTELRLTVKALIPHS